MDYDVSWKTSYPEGHVLFFEGVETVDAPNAVSAAKAAIWAVWKREFSDFVTLKFERIIATEISFSTSKSE